MKRSFVSGKLTSFKAGVNMNLSEILELKVREELKGKKGYGTPPDS